MNIPAGIAAEAAMTRQAVGLSVIKQNADAEAKAANIIAEAAESIADAGTASRGRIVDLQT